jgi:hypothetical protein
MTQEEKDALLRSFCLAGVIGGSLGSTYEIAEIKAAMKAINLTRLANIFSFGYLFGVMGNLFMESINFSNEYRENGGGDGGGTYPSDWANWEGGDRDEDRGGYIGDDWGVDRDEDRGGNYY